jgi:FPC/CPF motif-containing protein YcgG
MFALNETQIRLSPLEKAREEVRSLLTQKNYPCIAAQHSLRRDECMIELFRGFGSGEGWRALRAGLLGFIEEQKRSGSGFLSYWAVFEESPVILGEEEFESALWRELSCLTSEEEKFADWKEGKCLNPQDTEFRFSLAGSEIFVVGLHPGASRRSRRFYAPTLVFNVFTQFEQLQVKGHYEGMVRTIRARERQFEGTVNPMVEQHGETWETVQFSGRNNSSKWKCPFRFLWQAEKP